LPQELLYRAPRRALQDALQDALQVTDLTVDSWDEVSPLYESFSRV